MKQLELKNYRIREKHLLTNGGERVDRFYPQYRSRWFGWRYMNEYFPVGRMSGFMVFSENMYCLFGIVLFCVGVVFGSVLLIVSGNPILLLLCMIGGYFSIRFGMRTHITNELARFSSIDKAKDFIMNECIKEYEKKINNKSKKKNLPGDDIHFLNLQIERSEKLKKLKRKIRL